MTWSLDDDVLGCVLRHCALADAVALRAVSRQFRRVLAECDAVWRACAVARFSDALCRTLEAFEEERTGAAVCWRRFFWESGVTAQVHTRGRRAGTLLAHGDWCFGDLVRFVRRVLGVAPQRVVALRSESVLVRLPELGALASSTFVAPGTRPAQRALPPLHLPSLLLFEPHDAAAPADASDDSGPGLWLVSSSFDAPRAALDSAAPALGTVHEFALLIGMSRASWTTSLLAQAADAVALRTLPSRPRLPEHACAFLFNGVTGCAVGSATTLDALGLRSSRVQTYYLAVFDAAGAGGVPRRLLMVRGFHYVLVFRDYDERMSVGEFLAAASSALRVQPPWRVCQHIFCQLEHGWPLRALPPLCVVDVA